MPPWRKKSKLSEAVSFEKALAKLEEIVRELEDGQLGLSESLSRYEEGVRHLKQCHSSLASAEQKIQLLTAIDQEGAASTQPFDMETGDIEEQQQTRSRRRRQAPPDVDTDSQKGLF